MRLISVRAGSEARPGRPGRRPLAARRGPRRGRSRDDGRPARAAAATALDGARAPRTTRTASAATAGPSSRPTSWRRSPRPGKVVAIGRNYRDHAAEEGVDPPPAPLIFAKWPSADRRARRGDPLGPGADGAGRLRGRAGRRHRHDRAPGVGGRRPRPRPRLHLPQRRLGARPPVRRRPVDPRQVARHVLPDGPGARDRRRDPRPAGARDRVPRERRGPAAREHRADVLRRRGDHQPLLDGVHARARRRHRDRDAGRRRDLPRPAGAARRRRRGDGRRSRASGS